MRDFLGIFAGTLAAIFPPQEESLRIKPEWRKTAKRTGSIAQTQPHLDFSAV